MKKKNWYRGLSLADDKYIDEARPDKVIRSKKKRVLVSIIAASAMASLIYALRDDLRRHNNVERYILKPLVDKYLKTSKL